MFTPADANLWILATFAGTAKKLGKLEERHQDSPKKAKIEELAARFETILLSDDLSQQQANLLFLSAEIGELEAA